MDHELHGAIADASRYQRIRQPVEAIKHIEAKLIDTQFDQPVDGVRGSSWFQDLYCMDAELQLAQGTDEQQSGTVGPRGTGNPVKDFLEGAQQCKRRLERAIQEANGTGGGT